MSNFFILAYRFLRSNKIIFYLFLTGFLFLTFLFASRIVLEENISGVVNNPSDSTLYNKVVGNLRFSEKLIIDISLSDSNESPDPDRLALFARQFVDSLKARFDSSFVSSIEGEIPDSAVTFFLSYVYDHLPFYLDDQDYEKISERINPDSVRVIMEKNYQSMISPAGMVTKKLILQDPLGIGFIALKKLRMLQAGENYMISRGFIFTKDLRNLLVFINPANPPSETSRNTKLIKGIDEILHQLRIDSGEKVQGSYFGSIAMAVGNASQLKKDILLTLSIALFAIILFIGLYFRSIRIPLLGFLPALFGGGFALAVLFLIKGHLSAIALGIGCVILGLIVDYALYFINRFRKNCDIEQTIRELSLTIFLCSITSAGAFLCLLFLRSAVLHDLGWFAALSVIGAAFFALIILPQFITKADSGKWQNPGFPFIDRLSSFPFEKKSLLIISLVILGIISFLFIRKVQFENDMMALNYTTPELQKAEQDINRITGVSLKNLYIVSAAEDLENSLKIQEKVQIRLREMKENSLIQSYSGIGAAILSDSSQQAKIAAWKAFWTEERTNGLKNYLLIAGKEFKFKETAFSPFYALLENNFQPLDGKGFESAKSIFGKDWITESEDLSMVYAMAKTSQDNLSIASGMFSDIRGVVVFDRQSLTDRFVENVRHDFELLVRLSMIFVTLLLLISFGRIELTLITAIPMFFSWLITLGFMGLTGIKFNIFNIIISSFIFGLGVDYSIIMTRALQYKYRFGYAETGTYKISIILSSATTIFGVTALFFARHPALNSIALISIFGVSMVVLSTFVFQPLLMTWFFQDRLDKKTFPVSARIFIKTFITWGNIVLIGIIMMITGMILTWLVPFKRSRKEIWFHTLFSRLCRTYIAVTFPFSRKLINQNGENFKKPAVIISNHQSLIETPAFLRLHPKIIILTNNWVWNSWLFGPVARFASYYNVEFGIDTILDKLREKVGQGYSILVFPEGHRSSDNRIQRFHRGAFYMAEKLQLDILPIMVFGSGDFLRRGAFWGRPNALYMKILERIPPDDKRYGVSYQERTKNLRQFYIRHYPEFKAEFGTCKYYRKLVILNFICKSPVLEWYVRIKLKLSSDYEQFHTLLPGKGTILDIGCGYGIQSFMLSLTGEDRRITGIDFDSEKIETARNGFLRNDRLQFICADISKFPLTPHDAFILSDMLHYLRKEDQEELLRECIRKLNPGGVIVIRDADCKRTGKQKSTVLTEFFSTRILGFNKTGESKELYFTSFERIQSIAKENHMVTEVIQEARHTSNILITIRHSG